MKFVYDYIIENSLIMGFLFVGVILGISLILSKYLFKERIHASAIAVFLGLILAYAGGAATGGEHGIADIPLFSGIGIMGGSMFRDFAVVSTSFGADLREIKQCGKEGLISLFAGVVLSFVIGAIVALTYGYETAADITIIASGAVSFIVGPVTASALGIHSEVVAVSIAAGVIKSIAIMTIAPFAAKKIGVTTPKTAIIFGAMMGSTSGVSAGLAAYDEELVPYGAMMATFYLGAGCLICPTVLYGIVYLMTNVL